MRILSLATVAGAALLVAACGGGAANNTANAPAVDNGTAMGNDMMAPDMNAPMPAGNESMNSTTTTTAAPGGNTTTTTTNTATANHM
ncbi:hypothetical protein [Allosphingosinicella sp.]|uniref:hypothetical protein n=1 Tax=Allosphingosinicella sp. TaxID=2823234 RepID=UPI003784147E